MGIFIFYQKLYKLKPKREIKCAAVKTFLGYYCVSYSDSSNYLLVQSENKVSKVMIKS